MVGSDRGWGIRPMWPGVRHIPNLVSGICCPFRSEFNHFTIEKVPSICIYIELHHRQIQLQNPLDFRGDADFISPVTPVICCDHDEGNLPSTLHAVHQTPCFR